jgi:lipopolysaccharide/colanic/teichoic acid biosynthesis glycosyltransferase
LVAGPGSAAGIDAARFAAIARQAPRSQTVGFVGRLTRDKGIVELIDALETLKIARPEVRLLLVGDFEEGDPLPTKVRQRILNDPAILLTGFVDDATPFYADIDVVALPSYREGFPLVALEAAAAARPIVAADCTGMRDAVVDGKTGLIIPVGDSQALAKGLLQLLNAPETAARMGQAARGRVLRQFQPDLIWSEKFDLYERLLQSNPIGRPVLQEVAKRAFDTVTAAALLVLFSPLIAVIALALFATGNGPVLFSQVRPGRHRRPFVIHKFRTMSDERTTEGELLSDEERLTSFGRFLRRWSLDELPQLWSVLRGDMSLVGPRPLLSEYVSRYSPRQARRLLAPPGLTGWAQVNGRNQSAWEARLELDVWYVENWSLWLDARILARTLGIVVTGRGVEARESATPPPFLGVLHRRP